MLFFKRIFSKYYVQIKKKKKYNEVLEEYFYFGGFFIYLTNVIDIFFN